MKNLLNIVSVFVYVLLSMGMTLSIHFCGETVTAIQALPFDSASNLCGCDETCGIDACCKDEIKSIQLHDEQLVAQTLKISVPQSEVFAGVETRSSTVHSSEVFFQYTPDHSPPPKSSLYLLNSTLLI